MSALTFKHEDAAHKVILRPEGPEWDMRRLIATAANAACKKAGLGLKYIGRTKKQLYAINGRVC